MARKYLGKGRKKFIGKKKYKEVEIQTTDPQIS